MAKFWQRRPEFEFVQAGADLAAVVDMFANLTLEQITAGEIAGVGEIVDTGEGYAHVSFMWADPSNWTPVPWEARIYYGGWVMFDSGIRSYTPEQFVAMYEPVV